MKQDCYLTSYTQINSKWISDLNIRPETIKYIRENIGTKVMDLDLRDDLMDLSSKAREVKAKINK